MPHSRRSLWAGTLLPELRRWKEEEEVGYTASDYESAQNQKGKENKAAASLDERMTRSVWFQIATSYKTERRKETETLTMVSITMVRFPWPSVKAT